MKCFVSKEELLTHNKKSHFCEICDNFFYDTVNYHHKYQYHKERKEKCEYCDKSFHKLTELQKHISAKHQMLCKICSEVFSSKEMLEDHFSIKHKGKY